MFTGIVEEVGVVRAATWRDGALQLAIDARRVLDGLAPGDSIAIDGVCQTVVARDDAGFAVEAVATTLARTTFGTFAPGRRVNLERPLPWGARLGGHLVQGHVDGTGVVLRIEPRPGVVLVDLRLPDEVAEVTVPRGSLAVNGVSLTVQELPGPGIARVAIIPYTWEHTAFPDLRPGDAVNLEGDLIGRFVVHYLNRAGPPAPAASPARTARAGPRSRRG